MKQFSLTLAIIGLLVPSAYAQGVRLVINNGTQSDTVHIHFNAGSSTGFDNATDQPRSPQTGNGHNYIYADANGTPLRLNYVPLPDSSFSVPVSVFVQSPGYIDFTLEAEPAFAPGTRFVLETLWTGPSVELQPGVPLQQYLLANDISDPPAFALHVFPSPAITVTSPSCSDALDGALQVSFGHSRSWILNVYDSAPTLLYSFQVSGHDTILPGLQADNYTIGIGGPEFYSAPAAITAPAPVDATFSLVTDSIYTGQPVQLVNNASANNTSTWDFGDGSPLQSGSQPYYMYTTAGSYIITQTVTTAGGCTASFGHKVDVLPGLTTGIAAAGNENAFSYTAQNGQLTVHYTAGNSPYEIAIYSIDGRLVETLLSEGGDVSTTLPVNAVYVLRTRSVKDNVSFAKTIYISSL